MKPFSKFQCLLLLLVGTPILTTAGSRDAAAVFYDAIPGQNREFAGQLVQQAAGAGYTAELISLAELTNSGPAGLGRFGLLILPNARSLPLAAITSVEEHLKARGNVLALGVPAWQTGLFQIGTNWLGREEYEAILDRQPAAKILEDFSKADLARWSHNADRSPAPTRLELVPEKPDAALHVVVEKYTGWDTVGSPLLTAPFPGGHTLTTFRAKGGSQTKQLSLEWTEKDESRWIATIDITTNWQSHALPPEAFKAWQPPASRQRPGDRFNPANAVRFTVGIAMTHTANQGERHEYWFDDVGTAPSPFGDAVVPGREPLPHIEGICPDYLVFPITTPTRLQTPDGIGLVGREAGPSQPAGSLLAFHPRSQGAGHDQQRPWRWQPLLEARDADGTYRGAVGLWRANLLGPCAGSIWATFTPDKPAFYQTRQMQALLGDTLSTMRRGLFLKDGGSQYFTVFEDQEVRLGATVVNFGQDQEAKIQIRVETPGGRRTLHSTAWVNQLKAGTGRTVEKVWKPEVWPKDGCRVTVELLQQGRVIDRLSHEVNVWKPRAHPDFVVATNGGFLLKGKPWKAHGVNYMPSTGIGLASDYFENWVGLGAYDPEVIQRDLERIKGMGLNAVSVFIYHQSLKAQHLLDFLYRCEKLGLKVNQSLRPGTPMEFRWEEMRSLIEYYRLAQNDTVFAYDLAWEPCHFDPAFQRTHYPLPWNKWVIQHHGTMAAAEAAWSFPAPRLGGAFDVPAGEHVVKDGPWRKMVADYRQFLDEWTGQHYAEARRLVRSVDPHHPVSFRMTTAGDPTHLWAEMLPYDFYGLAQAVDIWEPEAYGRIGDWERVKPGHFTAAYARLCNPALPLMWAEMGNSVWDMSTMQPSPEKLAFNAGYYASFYKMMIQSGVDGVFFWWYPGGFRLYENSDYGIINPDGTDRSISKVIRTEGSRFLKAPKPKSPDYWISVDRDRDARGLNGIYETAKEEYWKAIQDGRRPGLKWAKSPGSK